MEASQCPSGGMGMKEQWCMHAMEYCLATEKKGILPSVTAWVDPEGMTLSEISQRKKDTT